MGYVAGPGWMPALDINLRAHWIYIRWKLQNYIKDIKRALNAKQDQNQKKGCKYYQICF